MARLLVHVEGETEETFVMELLRPHLVRHGYHDVSPRLLGNARIRDRRGGIRGWHDCRKDIIRHLKEDAGRYVTTFVDYYALPSGENPQRAWPGRKAAAGYPFSQKAQTVESALLADLTAQLPGSGDRFIPFVVMHEFEGLLFSDPATLAASLCQPHIEKSLAAIRSAFRTPEEINDSPVTAPSKRLMNIVAGYQKPLFGNLAALDIGLQKIRTECPHFHQWLEKLEAIPNRRLAT